MSRPLIVLLYGEYSDVSVVGVFSDVARAQAAKKKAIKRSIETGNMEDYSHVNDSRPWSFVPLQLDADVPLSEDGYLDYDALRNKDLPDSD